MVKLKSDIHIYANKIAIILEKNDISNTKVNSIKRIYMFMLIRIDCVVSRNRFYFV